MEGERKGGKRQKIGKKRISCRATGKGGRREKKSKRRNKWKEKR